MAAIAKTTKKPAIGNPSSDTAIQQEQNAISGVSRRKRRKIQAKSKPINMAVILGIALVSGSIVGIGLASIVNRSNGKKALKS